MDEAKPKVMENITEKKSEWTERFNKNIENLSINEEKELVIEKYSKVLDFLKGIQIKNKEDLFHIKKPLEDLESYMKYIPNGPLFNDIIPTEIKDHILKLSFPCDSSAFKAAAVCREWRGILETRLISKEAIIREFCSKCEDNKCVRPEDMLKAATVFKLDVDLVIGKPVNELDPKIVTDALLSVSKFSIIGNPEVSILSSDQFEHLFTRIEKGDKIMEEVYLDQLNLQNLNQERLAYCLINKIKRVSLEYVDINVETFITQLQDSSNIKLSHLTLRDFDLSSANAADELCKVENVKICNVYVPIPSELLERLMYNILHMPIRMKTLIIARCKYWEQPCINFGPIINPQDLKTLFIKMATLKLDGEFTLEQLEAVKSLPDVKVIRERFNPGWEDYYSAEFYYSVRKGSSERF